MARGWESKSVEEQQSQFTKAPELETKGPNTEEILYAQRVQVLKLARASVRQQLGRSHSERHKDLLHRELQHLETQLATLTKN